MLSEGLRVALGSGPLFRPLTIPLRPGDVTVAGLGGIRTGPEHD